MILKKMLMRLSTRFGRLHQWKQFKMKAKKKISLIVLGFKKKPNPTIKGYVTSSSVKDQ